MQGGGGCGIENLRTLCVRCHSAVTAQQATERTAARRAAMAEERQQQQQQPSGRADAVAAEGVAAGGRGVRRGLIQRAKRGPVKRFHVDSSSDDGG